MATDRLFNQTQGDSLLAILAQIRDGYNSVDGAFSLTSENPLQNKKITGAVTDTIETLGGTAQKSYAIGQYFLANDGYYYVATAAITAGSSNISSSTGGNCSKTCITAAMNNLSSQISNLNSKTLFTSCSVGADHPYTDVNNLPINSIAYGYTNALHAPAAQQYVYFTYASTDAVATTRYYVQLAVRNSDTANEMWVRFNQNGSWNSWKRLINTDDISSYATKSELSSYATTTELNSLLTVSSVTVSGVVAISPGGYNDITIPVSKSGYSFIGIVGVNISGVAGLVPQYFLKSDVNKATIRIFNPTNNTLTPGIVGIVALFMKS